MQQGLFSTNDENSTGTPLAHRARPHRREDYVGLNTLIKRYPFLSSDKFPSLLIWGPPGTGKTTLAQVLTEHSDKEFHTFSAVLSGVADLKKLIAQVKETKSLYGKDSVIFIDEIHRFNKAQQDALLPHVESGSFVLIGATTENPRSSVNRALLSRMQIVELYTHKHANLVQILVKTAQKEGVEFEKDEFELMAEYSNGDARKALNNLEMGIELKKADEFELDKFKKIILENARNYDSNQDRHYDVISAFIKSMRGSDPDAALLWLAVMLDGGEDPVFIARRLVIFASEDVGNADLQALNMAVNGLQVVQQIGMPEARITLSQVTTYLASTVKSNAAYMAINEALDYVQSNPTQEVPLHLRNFPPKNHPVKYKYPHAEPGSFVKQEYAPPQAPQFYRPKDNGVEKNIKDRLSKLWNGKKTY
ncbi:replication-associated recombination protein A [Bacteriovorax sp. DB6_IX]|uniref:replication-associated recombination protein A n=1 Tax=Bacteriovorax sp. DB6_IX TaxID=1353530 RepID=UPI00038A32AD|nr:replication-associated recombination protein A [Bacteriovorax sp. DB6_IX]EQC51360.1 DNA polymerase III, delta subunit [Bacteriovorax sp. DB6_IX]